MESESTTRHYFVDEAGDLSLFNRRGVSLIGREGVSYTFMLGIADLPDPVAAHSTLESLRDALLSDPYFKGVPSMQPEAGKTAKVFHAKDDVAEVRREVFRLLPSLGAKVHVAVRRKTSMVAEARNLLRMHGRRVTDGRIYDALVKTLFKNLLHQANENHVTFARRGKSSRQVALQDALVEAQKRFEKKWGKGIERPIKVETAVPSDSAGLQVVDYYLWALQRMFERREDRFYSMLADQYRLIIDLDDRRKRKTGAWYSARNNAFSLEKMMPVTG